MMSQRWNTVGSGMDSGFKLKNRTKTTSKVQKVDHDRSIIYPRFYQYFFFLRIVFPSHSWNTFWLSKDRACRMPFGASCRAPSVPRKCQRPQCHAGCRVHPWWRHSGAFQDIFRPIEKRKLIWQLQLHWTNFCWYVFGNIQKQQHFLSSQAQQFVDKSQERNSTLLSGVIHRLIGPCNNSGKRHGGSILCSPTPRMGTSTIGFPHHGRTVISTVKCICSTLNCQDLCRFWMFFVCFLHRTQWMAFWILMTMRKVRAQPNTMLLTMLLMLQQRPWGGLGSSKACGQFGAPGGLLKVWIFWGKMWNTC